MTGRVFIDSNIWLYALIEDRYDTEKRERAVSCIENSENIHISTQVVNEVCVNLIRKGKKDLNYIDCFLKDFTGAYPVMSQTKEDLLGASNIRLDYRLSYWDSLIVAGALQADCQILYSEDMQDGLQIYNRLEIRNPLVA